VRAAPLPPATSVLTYMFHLLQAFLQHMKDSGMLVQLRHTNTRLADAIEAGDVAQLQNVLRQVCYCNPRRLSMPARLSSELKGGPSVPMSADDVR
jgi:hypothetical protein